MYVDRWAYPNGDTRNWQGAYENPDGTLMCVRPEFAGALTALNEEFRERFGHSLYVNEGGRSIETQWHYWNLYLSGEGNLAGYPGTSTHGFGLAVDMDWPISSKFTEEHAWLRENAHRFGIYWQGVEEGWVQEEPWHWAFDGRNVSEEQGAIWADTGREILIGGIMAKATESEKAEIMAAVRLTNQRLLDIQKGVDEINFAITHPKNGVYRKVTEVRDALPEFRAFKDKTLWALADPKLGLRELVGQLVRALGRTSK